MPRYINTGGPFVSVASPIDRPRTISVGQRAVPRHIA